MYLDYWEGLTLSNYIYTYTQITAVPINSNKICLQYSKVCDSGILAEITCCLLGLAYILETEKKSVSMGESLMKGNKNHSTNKNK